MIGSLLRVIEEEGEEEAWWLETTATAEESASSCGWSILLQAVLGASRSKFCGAKEEPTPSLLLLFRDNIHKNPMNN